MDLGRELIGIAAVLVMLFGLLWILRRKGWVTGIAASSSTERQIRLLERVSLTPAHSLHLVRAGNRTILLGAHASGVTLICDIGEKT